MLGVFMALDFFLFYVFWEVMLLPMYFLIGVWGGPRREYAAIKFFLFTMAGSVLMLVALLALYFNSDLNQLGKLELAESHVHPSVIELHNPQAHTPLHTFNLLALALQGQADDSPFNQELLSGKSIQWWTFLLLLIGFPRQGAIRTRPYLVARRPRRSSHANLHDPRRRAAQDGRLRYHPHLLSNLPAGSLRIGLARLLTRRDQYGLRCFRRLGPDRLQAIGGLQLRFPTWATSFSEWASGQWVAHRE